VGARKKRVAASGRASKRPVAREPVRDYHGHMARVGVAELKAKLSAYLRRAERGEEIVVLDRDAPVAKLTPYAEPRPRPLGYRPATKPFGSAPKGAPLPKLDVDAALAEERRDRQ